MWRSLVARYLGVVEVVGSSPVTQTKFLNLICADVAELADAPDLGSGGYPRECSSHFIRTRFPPIFSGGFLLY